MQNHRIQLQTTAFRNPDGSMVVVVMNAMDKKLPYSLWINGQVASAESLPHSISTLIIR